MRRGVWNIGHRGAAGLEPENTLRSFRRAAAEGAGVLEVDLRLTVDGRLVAMHDPTLDRTTDGTGPVREVTLADLRRLDAGLGERVPTFEEVLEVIGLPIHAEVKAYEAAEPLAKIIRNMSLARRVTPICFSGEILRRVKRIVPDQPVGLICPDVSTGVVREASSIGAAFVSAQASSLNTGTAGQLKRADLKVTAWTVNQPGEMRRLIDLGVDGIVTDHPDLLAELFSSRA